MIVSIYRVPSPITYTYTHVASTIRHTRSTHQRKTKRYIIVALAVFLCTSTVNIISHKYIYMNMSNCRSTAVYSRVDTKRRTHSKKQIVYTGTKKNTNNTNTSFVSYVYICVVYYGSATRCITLANCSHVDLMKINYIN